LGVCILTILKTIKEDNKITPTTKRLYNFLIDIARTDFYTLSLVFIQPFVFENNNDLLYFAFWFYVVAALFFVIRKVLKWKYYMFSKEGKLILGPWESKDVMSKENLAKFA
jgi:hypothetical protein